MYQNHFRRNPKLSYIDKETWDFILSIIKTDEAIEAKHSFLSSRGMSYLADWLKHRPEGKPSPER
jgi:hypothetical protein